MHLIDVSKAAKARQWEYAVPGLATLSLLVSCVFISAKKHFWNDEFFSYYLLSDKSFGHMLAAFHDKINAAPPLYFIFGGIWARPFGSSELSLRLFSCLGMCAALWLLWNTLRRTYDLWPTAIGALSIFCTSGIILAQNAEARMYGLFVALCALGLYLYDTACRTNSASWGLVVGTVCTHAAIINTHLFGIIYSAALLISLILRDRYFNSFKANIYLSIVLSWLSLLPYIPSFLNQSDAVKPRAWLPTPTLRDLTEFIGISSSSFFSFSAFVLLILISGLQFVCRGARNDPLAKRREEHGEHPEPQLSLLIAAYAFFIVPVFIWVLSRSLKPMFYNRYMSPTALSWSILVAYVAARMLGPGVSADHPRSLGGRLRVLLNTSVLPVLLVCFLLTQPLVWARQYNQEPIPGLTDDKFGYTELPIVVQRSHDFLKRLHYSANRSRYFFILDWEAAIDEASGLFGPQEYKELAAIGRNYPELGKQIVDSAAFLKAHDRFLVIDYPDFDKKCPPKVTAGLHTPWEDDHCPQWVEKRLLNNPHYDVERLGDLNGQTVLLVTSR
jgi:hypothetical protein